MVTFYHNIGENTPPSLIDELLRIEKTYNIQATYNVVPKLYNKQAHLIKKISEAGHEISLYLDKSVPISDLQKELNRLKMKNISSILLGFHSLGLEMYSEFFETFWRNKFLWNAEIDNNEEPYFIYKGLVRLPIVFDNRIIKPDNNYFEKLKQKFSSFLESRKYFGYSLQNYNSCLQNYVEAYRCIIKLAIEKKVLVVTFSQAADLFRRSKLAHYYSITANDWNKKTRALYRTRRFQELIRNEVVKLKSPIIADLGSGGGVLSSFLNDSASKIYCIDNAEGMIGDIQKNSSIQTVLGEATDSTLPDNSVDLIICARVIEYIYNPGLVANEIKRIGKLGSKFIVTFPAYINDGPDNMGSSPPDKIRKHYTREEVLAFGNQVGSGKLIGIQYKQLEPKDINEEKSYRQIEEEQPEKQIPTNWVFIGKIENKKFISTNFKSLPINISEFHLE